MRRMLFLLSLMLYGWSAMDLHSWEKVPEVVWHMLEHHGDFDFSHHHDAAEHGHTEDEGHDPFTPHQHEACASISIASLPDVPEGFPSPVTVMAQCVPPAGDDAALSAFSGSKWNPPRRG